MKTIIFTALACFIFSQLFFSCKKDDTGAKVGVEEGKITLVDGDSTITFTIINIETEVSNDTTSILIESVNKDSSKYFYIGFEKIAQFTEKDYIVTDPEVQQDSYIYAYLRTGAGSNLVTRYYSTGVISVLKYTEKMQIQGGFEFIKPSVVSDTINVAKITGEFYASYMMLDPNRVANLPINPQTMEVSVNGVKTLLNARGAAIINNEEKQYVINGFLGSDMAVTISFVDIIPELNKIYKTGERIVVENDPTVTNDNDTGYVAASFFEKGVSYYAQDKIGTGKFIVTKLSSSTIQGTFDFTAAQQKDTTKKVKLESGMFYTKLKSY